MKKIEFFLTMSIVTLGHRGDQLKIISRYEKITNI
jgi:hypothetical protein